METGKTISPLIFSKGELIFLNIYFFFLHRTRKPGLQKKKLYCIVFFKCCIHAAFKRIKCVVTVLSNRFRASAERARQDNVLLIVMQKEIVVADVSKEELPASTAKVTDPSLPNYMREVYDWAYVNPSWVRWLDHNIVVKVLLFGNDRRMMRAYLDSIRPGSRVWQVAHVYGDLVRLAAQKCGPEGTFHLTDVTPIQIEHAHKKLDDLQQARIFYADAANFRPPHQYEMVCSFMLLHEVPEDWKRKVVNNMLNHLEKGGEAIFVDYHAPSRLQPVRYILNVVNAWLEPFANALWKNDIRTYADNAEDYIWEKRTLFGGVYQIVRARHKI